MPEAGYPDSVGIISVTGRHRPDTEIYPDQEPELTSSKG